MADQITTAAELDALPVTSTVIWRHNSRMWQKWETIGGPAWFSGKQLVRSSEFIAKHPADVLYRPDQQPTVQPTVEQIADAIHAAWDLDTPDDDEPCYCDLDAINDAARAVLALIPGRTEAEVRAEALASLGDLVSDWQANGNSRPLGDPAAYPWQECARQLLDRIEGATP